MELQIRSFFEQDRPTLCMALPVSEAERADSQNLLHLWIETAREAGYRVGRVLDMGPVRLIELLHDCDTAGQSHEDARRARRQPLQR